MAGPVWLLIGFFGGAVVAAVVVSAVVSLTNMSVYQEDQREKEVQ